MAKVSIIIPARGEDFKNLTRTLKSIYDNATGEFEVIVGFDGTDPYMIDESEDYPNLSCIDFPSTVGIKTNINAMCAMATGKYIYKSDAHCSFSKGFDEILQQDMQEDWIVTPRFYVLNGETWEWQDDRFYDYFYLCCPLTDPKGFRFRAGGHWPERTKERLNFSYADFEEGYSPKDGGGLLVVIYDGLDETPQIHGSGWFISKDRYFELGGFPNIDPYGHAQEPIWLGLKNWLAGGRVMVNKKCWYAHLHQQGNKRGYNMDHAQEVKSYDIAAKYWMGNKWAERKYDIQWFINEKFPNMPTWPKNWEELLKEIHLDNV